jgi:flagellar hook-basal body protein
MSTTSIAITGMNTAQAIINQTSNNIANIETPGFKAGLMDLYNISGDNGVGMLASNMIDKKGSLNYTGVVTDLATDNNESFFIVKNKINKEVVNMVTGSFRSNKDGQLEVFDKYLLLGAKYQDDGLQPSLNIDTLEPIVINNNIISNPISTKNVTENFNLDSSLLAKGQASFVMTVANPNQLAQLNNAGFMIQIQSEQNGIINTESVKCIYTANIKSNSYSDTTNSIATSGNTTDDIQIEYNNKPKVSIPRGIVAGNNDKTTLQNIADRINSVIGGNQAYVLTNNGISSLIIKPPLNQDESLFISGSLADSLGITTTILPSEKDSIRFSSAKDLENGVISYFSEIDINFDSQSLLFIAKSNTNVSMTNLDSSKDILKALGMDQGPVLGQGYDPYNSNANMASGAIVPDIIDSVTLYDSKGGQHIANIALKKVEDGWIQEVYMSNPYQIYGARSDGLVQITKFTFDSTGKLNTTGPVIPNCVTSAISDPRNSITIPTGGNGQFTLNGITFTQDTDFKSMIDLVNKINQDTRLQSDFFATIVKENQGSYNITIIPKGGVQPIINTNLFNVTNVQQLDDISNPMIIKFNPIENLETLNIVFDYSSISESVYKEMSGSVTADGIAPSSLTSISIDNTGDLIGIFANGTSTKLYKIPLATYANVNGLQVVGDNTLRGSSLSGEMKIQTPGSSTVGEILSGNIESSNVEQTEQLTKLMISKQFYNMNIKSWQTGNVIIDYLLNASNT